MILLLTCFLAGLGLACQRPSSQAQESLGPGSGGGGDYRADERLQDDDVAIALQQAKDLVPFALAYLETVITNARADGSSKTLGQGKGARQVPKRVYAALFPWPKPIEDVFSRWQRAKVILKSDGPCLDGHGEAKAMSAFPFESDEICASRSVIRSSATKANVIQRLTALLVHEIAHKAGVREEADAILLENAIVRGIPADPLRFLQTPVEALKQQIDPEKGEMAASVRRTLSLLARGEQESAPWNEICFELATMEKLGKGFMQDTRMDGYSLAALRPNLQAEELAIQRRTSVFAGYCHENARELIAGLFGSSGERSVSDGASGVLSIASGIWRKPRIHDGENLRAELMDIQRSLGQIAVGAGISAALIHAALEKSQPEKITAE